MWTGLMVGPASVFCAGVTGGKWWDGYEDVCGDGIKGEKRGRVANTRGSIKQRNAHAKAATARRRFSTRSRFGVRMSR